MTREELVTTIARKIGQTRYPFLTLLVASWGMMFLVALVALTLWRIA